MIIYTANKSIPRRSYKRRAGIGILSRNPAERIFRLTESCHDPSIVTSNWQNALPRFRERFAPARCDRRTHRAFPGDSHETILFLTLYVDNYARVRRWDFFRVRLKTLIGTVYFDFVSKNRLAVFPILICVYFFMFLAFFNGKHYS